MSWEYVKFTEIVDDITGGNRKFVSTEYLNEGKYPIVDQGEGIIAGYTNEEAKVFRDSDIVVFGDHTKAIKYIDFDFCLGADGVKVLQPKKGLLPKYLFRFLGSVKLPDVGYSRHFKFLKEITIPLPPLPIQKQIAEILDAADALRRKDQELLKKYDELAQAIFIDMFGDPVKNEKGWEVKKLGDEFNSIRYGTSTPPVYSTDGIPFLRATNIKGGRIEKKGMVYLSEDEANKIKKCFVNEGDLIIVRSGANTGDCAYITREYDRTLAGYDLIVEMDKVKSRFYNYLINSAWGKAKIEKLSRRAGQPHLNSEQVSNIEFISPEYSLLQKFYTQINTIESVRKYTLKSMLIDSNLFDSLIEKAFKGELVKEEELV